ncbi:hypothetical protein bcere0022_38830 [Bacillus cereus Rock3-44]|nr:hypothetical protein bcere0022_38830 [Bacillus cereus Rock3-44]
MFVKQLYEKKEMRYEEKKKGEASYRNVSSRHAIVTGYAL